MDFTQDIKPDTYLKSHTAEVLNQVQRSRSPMVITRNGHATAIILDMISYQQQRRALGELQLVAMGIQQVNQGKSIPHTKAMKQLTAHIKKNAQKK